MSKFKFKLNKSGVGEMLKSQSVINVCEKSAQNIQRKCGEGFETSKYTGKNRVNVAVFAESSDAIRECMENNTLRKAIGK